MWTLNFWRQAIERAIKTAAQFLVGVLGAAQFDILTADWKTIGLALATGVVLSVLTSISSLGVGESDSPSLVAIASAPPEPEAAAA